MEKLSTLIDHFNRVWPESGTESWDHPGLMLGSPAQQVSRCLLVVDVTLENLKQAKEMGAELIISHHPLFLHGVHELSESTPKGTISAFAARNGIAVYAAHTNADFVIGGVTESLAAALRLKISGHLDPILRQGAIGKLEEPMTLLDFARFVARVLPSVAQGIRVAGDSDRTISNVGLVAGAGDSFLDQALAQEIDLFITSDLRHHRSLDFIEASKLSNGPALMDLSHWAAEWLWLEKAQHDLAIALPSIKFEVSDISTDPWDFVVMQ